MMESISQIEIQPKDLIPISIALVSLILFGFLLSNQWASFSTAEKELREEVALSQSLSSQKDLIIELKDREEDLIRDFQALNHIMPQETEYGSMLEYLQSIFIQYNLHVIQVQFNEEVQKEGYSEIPMQISLNGEYEQIIRFIRDFRYGDRLFRVDELYMDRENDMVSQIYCDLLSSAFVKTSSEE